jgi:hypothetical protein
MPENFALYSQEYDSLPDAEMQALASPLCPARGITERGLTYSYQWPDLTILVSVLPAQETAEHLRGFAGYIRDGIYHGTVPRRGERIIHRVLHTRLVVGVELQPGRDAEGRSELLLGKMCGGLRPILFHADALFDWNSRLLLAPDGSFDPAAAIEPKKWWQFWK